MQTAGACSPTTGSGYDCDDAQRRDFRRRQRPRNDTRRGVPLPSSISVPHNADFRSAQIVRCVTCSNFDLRKAGKLAPRGFGA